MNNKTLVWVVRFIVFALFVVSAVAKMFPIWAFEKQLVDLGVASWCLAPFLSRALIGFELAIGLAIMQPHFLKKIVIPATIALLVVFCVHLSIEMVKHGAMNGNCGCFGQLIPMTPLEAFVKNIITIGLLIFLYKKSVDKERGKNRFSVLLVIWLASTLLLFVSFPFCPCAKEKPADTSEIVDVYTDSSDVNVDTSSNVILVDSIKTTTASVAKQDSTTLVKPLEKGPAKVKSRFSDVNVFSGKKVNIDEGKKVICFFAAGCDHCQETAKKLKELSKKPGFPPVYIYFMDEETHLIPEFFKIAKGEFPYKVLDIPQFWTMIGPDGTTPGVFYLWNGNIITYFVGIEDKAFKQDELLKAMKL